MEREGAACFLYLEYLPSILPKHFTIKPINRIIVKAVDSCQANILTKAG